MKKLVALLVALCMAALMLPALAEETAVPSGVTLDVSISLNPENAVSLFSGMSEKMANAAVSLINNLSFHAANDGVDTEVSLKLKEENLLGFAVLNMGEEGYNVYSTLFPSYALKVSADMLQSLMPSAGGEGSEAAAGLDVTAITEALTAKIESITQTVTAAFGAPEAVSETYEGVEFTAYMPINLSTRDLLTIVTDIAKTVISQPAFSSALAMSGTGMDASSLNESLESIANTKDEELPETVMGVYTNEAADVLFVADLTKDEENLNVTMMRTAARMIALVTMQDQVLYSLDVDNVTGNFTAVNNTNVDGVATTVSVVGQGSESGFSLTMDIDVNEAHMATVDMAYNSIGTLTGFMDTADKTVIDATALMSGESDALQNLLTEIQSTGLMGLISAASKVMPQEVTDLMNATTQTTNAD